MTSISAQAIGLAAWEHEARDDHGRWTRTGDVIDKVTEPIGQEGARGNSRPVSHDEFQQLAAEGRDRLRAIQRAPWNTDGLRRDWPAIKERMFAEVQKPWGGATIDPRTGVDLPQGADKYAMSIKPSGLDTTSVPETASRSQFSEAMDVALSKYERQLSKGGSYLGVFHDDDLNRIDIDPVTVLDSQREVETIGAYTHAIGGAYHFASGNGFWPPHVPEGAQMSNSDQHWEGPGQWHSHAVEVQEPHDEPEDGEPGTITGQIAELAAWQHERRGPHGQWVSTGKSISGQVGDIGRSKAAQRSRRMMQHRQQAASIARQVEAAAEHQRIHDNKVKAEAAIAAAQTRVHSAHARQEIIQKHADDMHRTLSQIRSLNQRLSAMEEQREAEKSKVKLAIHIAALVAGAVLAAIEAKLGTPDLLTIASSIGPMAVQELFDWAKRL